MIDESRVPTAADPTSPGLDHWPLSLRAIRQMARLMPSEMFAEVMVRNGVPPRRVTLAFRVEHAVLLAILVGEVAGMFLIPVEWWPLLVAGVMGLMILWEFLEWRSLC